MFLVYNMAEDCYFQGEHPREAMIQEKSFIKKEVGVFK